MEEIFVDNEYLRYGFHYHDGAISITIYDGDVPDMAFIVPVESVTPFIDAMLSCFALGWQQSK